MKNFPFIGFFILLFLFAGCHQQIPPPQNLKCEYKENPLDIDQMNPRFFWEVSNEIHGTYQSAYQILVASSDDLLSEKKADVWNSGKVISNQNIQVKYEGKPLSSCQRYFWRVKIWNKDGLSSDYSETSWFETALMSDSDWEAKWINNGIDAPENEAEMYKDIAAPLFRKEFAVEKKVKSARLYISGLGYYEAFLNGKKTGNYVLNPGWTNYNKRVQYNTYDVTKLLTSGNNALGVILGNGWYNPLPLPLFGSINLRKILATGQPKLITQLKIDFTDGTDTLIVSDETWKTSGSPILTNNVYLGEKYDARLEQDGWDMPGFNEDTWSKVKIASPPGGELVAQIQESVRITKEIKPVRVNEVKPGIFIFDMGQNFAGCARLKVKGVAGTRVELRYGELLNEDGSLNDKSTIACHIYEGSGIEQKPGAPQNANQKDIYILKGIGEETYNSRFTFHGFRYIEMTGYPGNPDIDALTGLRMNSDFAKAGYFECSNPLFNQIQQNVEWTFLSNVFSVQSDCPGREKFGYGGDMVSASEAYIYNYSMPGFYTKTIHDFQDEQKASGGMPECAPDNGIYSDGLAENTGPVGWMLAHPFLLDKMFLYYGDADLLEEQYQPLKALTDFIALHANGYIIEKGIGDHAGIALKDKAVTGTAFFYYCVKKTAEIAGVLNKLEDQEQYSLLGETIKKRFIEEFVNSSTGAVGNGTQASQAFALYFKLVPEEGKEKVLQFLINDIENNYKSHLSTGIFGTKFLFDVLREANCNDLVYSVNNQRSFPSYGYMIDNGATTLWEEWNGDYSQNHPMFGSVSEWFYKSLAGISPSTDANGFDKIILKPSFTEGLKWVNGSYQSIRGKIGYSWNNTDGNVTMEVNIPGNTNANIFLQNADRNSLKVNGTNIRECKTIDERGIFESQLVLSVQSGKYYFQFKLKRE